MAFLCDSMLFVDIQQSNSEEVLNMPESQRKSNEKKGERWGGVAWITSHNGGGYRWSRDDNSRSC
jgi:hypothetical protein